jgi:DNA-binding PucR family transcriptional regulator
VFGSSVQSWAADLDSFTTERWFAQRPAVREVDPVSRSNEFEDWLGRFVSDSLQDGALDRFVEVVDGEIVRGIPELGADPVLVEDLSRSTRHQWIAFLQGLRHAEHGLALPAQAKDLARSLARRSQDVKVLLRVYLTAHRGVFAYLTEAIDARGAGGLGTDFVLREVWKRADLWMDESVETLIETYFEERQRELDGSAALRAELVAAILAGEDVDAERVSKELSYPVTGWHTAFLVWADEVSHRTAPTLRQAAESVAKCFTGGRLYTELAGSRDVRAWVATPRPPAADVLAAVRELDLPGVSMALGVSAPGLDGFRTSHEEASSAQHLALTAATAPRFVDYRAVEVLCLALADRVALLRMVQREIAPLCGPDKNLEPVRETVLTYLTNRMNVEATAERLYVHGNTVRYRLAKAEELLGCQLAERPRQIELALQYVTFFGSPL